MATLLNLEYADFKRHVAHHLGYNASSLSQDEVEVVEDAVQGGYRTALYNNPRGYQWRFLQSDESIVVGADVAVDAGRTVNGTPNWNGSGVTRLGFNTSAVMASMIGRVITITDIGTHRLIAGATFSGGFTDAAYIDGAVAGIGAKTYSIESGGDFRLPGSFAGMSGPLTFAAADNAYCSVPVRGESTIRDLRQRPAIVSGEPRVAAIVPDRTGWQYNGPDTPWTKTSQLFALRLWPTPDATYTLTWRNARAEDTLSKSNPYPPGGPAHAEMFLAAMLAYAEQRSDDEKGLRSAEFIEKLDASIRLDRRQFGAELLGYNGDRSDTMYGGAPWRRDNYRNLVTANGVIPE